MDKSVPLVRSFIALPLPGRIRNTLGAVQKKIQGNPGIRARFPKSEGLHITLRFLGDISARDLERVKTTMDNFVHNRSGFSLKLSGLGVFPRNKRFAKIFWAGISGDMPQLQQTYLALCRDRINCKMSSDRKSFSPHITLARFKKTPSASHIARMVNENLHLITGLGFRADAIHLYKSELTPRGARYTLLHESRFKT